MRHLSLACDEVPPALLRATAGTLASLELRLSSQTALEQLVQVAPHLTQTNFVTIGDTVAPNHFAAPPGLAAFVGGLPALQRLEVIDISPHQLEHLLVALKPGQRLEQLIITLHLLQYKSEFAADLGHVPEELARYAEEWVPTLRRCVDLAARRGVDEWVVGVLFVSFDKSPAEYEEMMDEEELDELDDWLDDWVAFQQDVEKAGIRLCLAPGRPLFLCYDDDV